MPILVISTSLNPFSLSESLCREAYGALSAGGAEAEFASLKDIALPLFDGSGFPGHEGLARLKRSIRLASGILLGAPIYNYSVGAAAKNLVELTGDAWRGKCFSLLCASGTKSSFMAAMPLVSTLILDFKCVFVPSFLHVQEASFGPGRKPDPDTASRLSNLLAEMERFSPLSARVETAVTA
jgi:FMN reductase